MTDALMRMEEWLFLKSVSELDDDEPEIQPGNQGGYDPSNDTDPNGIHKFAHDVGVAGKLNKGDDGKAQLHAENDLADKKKPGGGSLPQEGNHDDGGNNRK